MNNMRLRIVGGDHVATDGLTAIEVACLPDDYTVPPLDLIDCNDEATARRIVACVNRLAGFTTEEIENMSRSGPSGLVSRLICLEAQRDQLLAALQNVVDAWSSQFERQGHMAPEWCKQARATIAAVKGGAS